MTQRIYKYFVSYYFRDSCFKRGMGWADIGHNKLLENGNDILELQELIQKEFKRKKVIIINFRFFSSDID